MKKIDKDSMFYVLGQSSMAAVDKAIMGTLQFGLTQHPEGFGIHVSSTEIGPKVDFFTLDDASPEAIKFCDTVATQAVPSQNS